MFHKKNISNSLGCLLGLLFLACLVIDNQTRWFNTPRAHLYTVIMPLFELKLVLKKNQETFLAYLQQKTEMQHQLEAQAVELTLLKTQQNLVPALRAENKALSSLLKVSPGLGYHVKVARVIERQQQDGMQTLIVDKGNMHALHVGQGVVSETGVVGQVSDLSPFNSRIILISDLNHALMVENSRNEEELVLEGTGKFDSLVAHDVPSTADFQIGDLLVTSRYVARFLPHYPVARITRIENEGFASVIYAKPVAPLNALRFVMINTEDQDGTR